MNDENKTFFSEFADDAFAELDEHLIKVRRCLLKIESTLNAKEVDKVIYNDILLSLHTMKGISGMIGLSELSNLIHKIETFVKLLANLMRGMKNTEFDKLVEGIKIFEHLLNLYKTNNISDEKLASFKLDEFYNSLIIDDSKIDDKKIIEEQKIEKIPNETLDLSKDILEKINASLAKGNKLYKFLFTPSAELYKSGINVASIRSMLENDGELIHAAPGKSKENIIIFEFLLLSKKTLKDFEKYIGKGVEYHLFKSQELNEIDDNQSATVIKNKIPEQQTIVPSANLVRVELGKLDNLMRMIGELVISRARLEENIKNISKQIPTFSSRILQETNQAMERQLKELREGVMRIRLVPIGEAFERMQFVIRDLIRESKKNINLEIVGKETEIDKFVVEKIIEPLLHLVRNSVSHGIESEEDRTSLKKNPIGKISLRAFTSGDSVIIEIEDDGRGLDKEKIIKKGIEAGLIKSDDQIDSLGLLDIICSPGFSTRDDADLSSGRGIGMVVVKNVIQELGGNLEVESEKNIGTKFKIHLPLTLAIVDAMIVMVNSTKFAIPQPSVNEVLQIDSDQIKLIENSEIITYRKRIIPLVYLSEIFGLGEKPKGKMYTLLVGSEYNSVGIVVEKIQGLREIVVRSLSDPLVQIKGISGATELGDGKVVLILDAAAIIKDLRAKGTYRKLKKISIEQ